MLLLKVTLLNACDTVISISNISAGPAREKLICQLYEVYPMAMKKLEEKKAREQMQKVCFVLLK